MNWVSPIKDDDGKIYLVYHAYDRENDGRPQLQIEIISWENCWPVVA